MRHVATFILLLLFAALGFFWLGCAGYERHVQSRSVTGSYDSDSHKSWIGYTVNYR